MSITKTKLGIYRQGRKAQDAAGLRPSTRAQSGVDGGTIKTLRKRKDSSNIKKVAPTKMLESNHSTWEAEAGVFLSLRPAWSTKQVPGQPGLHRETLS